jgi:hypothetical protein
VASAGEIRLNRHGEPTGRTKCATDDRLSEAIHRPARIEWIASSLSLLAMTARSLIEPEIIMR